VEIGFQVQSGARPGMTSVLHLAHKKLSGQFGGDKSWEFDVTSRDGLFQIIGTPTPTPTTTPTPSATPTPTSTPPPTPTPTPTPSAIPTPPLTPTPIATPTLPPTATPYPTPEYLVLASGDYDGDGILDIAVFPAGKRSLGGAGTGADLLRYCRRRSGQRGIMTATGLPMSRSSARNRPLGGQAAHPPLLRRFG